VHARAGETSTTEPESRTEREREGERKRMRAIGNDSHTCRKKTAKKERASARDNKLTREREKEEGECVTHAEVR